MQCGGGEAYSPATLSRPDSPETVTNCRNDGVEMGDQGQFEAPNIDICAQRDSVIFQCDLTRSNNGRFGSMLLLLVQWQYIINQLIHVSTTFITTSNRTTCFD